MVNLRCTGEELPPKFEEPLTTDPPYLLVPAGHPPLSFSQEAALEYRLSLLYSVLMQYSGLALLPLLPELEVLAVRVFSVPLTGVQISGSHLLACICHVGRGLKRGHLLGALGEQSRVYLGSNVSINFY